tara:strand:- start:57 stop:389 length:333 start_codon:yes stop_codon:yes gene_type:complete
MITKSDAVLALKPGAIWTMRDDVLEWQDDNITAPTDSQITTKYNELVAAEPLNKVRDVRNIKLAETDWVVTMHKEKGTNIPTSMITYRQALRDITNSATSLDDVTWPEKP